MADRQEWESRRHGNADVKGSRSTSDRRAPSIYPEVFPPEFLEHCTSIINRLHALNDYIIQFDDTVKLFNAALALMREASLLPRTEESRLKKKELYLSWMVIAGRCGALTVYDFGSAPDGFSKTLPIVPKMLSLIDRTLLRKANKLFEKYFDDYTQLRNGAAHVEDKLQTVQEKTAHIISNSNVANQFNTCERDIDFSYMRGEFALGAKSAALIQTGVRSPCNFVTTWSGTLYELAISDQTSNQMIEVKDAYFDAFMTLEDRTRELRNQSLRPPTGGQ